MRELAQFGNAGDELRFANPVLVDAGAFRHAKLTLGNAQEAVPQAEVDADVEEQGLGKGRFQMARYDGDTPRWLPVVAARLIILNLPHLRFAAGSCEQVMQAGFMAQLGIPTGDA